MKRVVSTNYRLIVYQIPPYIVDVYNVQAVVNKGEKEKKEECIAVIFHFYFSTKHPLSFLDPPTTYILQSPQTNYSTFSLLPRHGQYIMYIHICAHVIRYSKIIAGAAEKIDRANLILLFL